MDSIISIINNAFISIALILVITIIIKSILKNNNEEVEIPKRTYNVLLLIVIIIGLFIRLWQFGKVPGGFNQDGAMAAYDGMALARYGTDRFGTWLPVHLYAWGYGQMSSLLSYFIAILVRIFGLSVIVARLPQLLASIMGGTFFYLFMKDNFGKRVGLISAFLVAINPWHFMQSRWALDCNLLPHFFMGGFYFFSKGLMTKKYFIYISMVFFALCMYCYGITIYTIPILLIAMAIYYFIKKKIGIKDILISSIIYLSISWPFILTMIVNYFKWDTIKLPFATIQYFSESVRANDILLFSNNIFKQILINIKSLISIVFIQKKDSPWNDVLGFGTMYLFTMPFVFLGMFGIAKTKIERNKSLLVFALLTGIWVGLMTNNVNVNRINIIYYGILMFATFGIYFAINNFKWTKFIIIPMYIVAMIIFINTYFTSYANDIAVHFFSGFGDALKAAESTDADQIYVTADAQFVGASHVSEILTLFYDQTDIKYFQGKTNMNHKEKYLPYKERFKYQSITQEIVEQTVSKNVAYVVTKNDENIFSDDKYKKIKYGNFYTIVKK